MQQPVEPAVFYTLPLQVKAVPISARDCISEQMDERMIHVLVQIQDEVAEVGKSIAQNRCSEGAIAESMNARNRLSMLRVQTDEHVCYHAQRTRLSTSTQLHNSEHPCSSRPRTDGERCQGIHTRT